MDDETLARIVERVGALETKTKDNTTRLTNTARRVEQVKRQVAKLDNDIKLNTRITADISAKLGTNTKLTEEVRNDTKIVIEVVRSIGGAVRVLEWVSKPAKVLILFTTMYAAFRLWMIDHLPVWFLSVFKFIK